MIDFKNFLLRKEGRRSVPLAITLAASLLAGGALAQAKTTQPNVLFIAIDDLRPVLGAYGDKEAQSPNIDRLAQQSTLFTEAYCQVPVCGASRASMLTGVLPTAERFTNFSSRADEDVPQVPVLPSWFNRNGYTTVSVGKIFHMRDDSAQSWSKTPWRPKQSHAAMLDPESRKHVGGERNRGPFFERAAVEDVAYYDGKVLEQSLKELKELSQKEEPFFLAVGFIRPHLPFYAPESDWEAIDATALTLAKNRELPADSPQSLRTSNEINFYSDRGVAYNSEEWHRISKHGYYACVRYVDRLVGELLDALEQSGQAQNTIVVLWGDHGFLLGEYNSWGKLVLLPEATRVPLIIRAPGVEAAVSDAVVETVDIYPTLCKLANLPLPEHLQGKPLPLPAGAKAAQDDAVAYSRIQNGDAVISGQYHYVRYKRQGGVEELLLDRLKDPQSLQNRAGSPEYATVLKQMRSALDDKMLQANRLK